VCVCGCVFERARGCMCECRGWRGGRGRGILIHVRACVRALSFSHTHRLPHTCPIDSCKESVNLCMCVRVRAQMCLALRVRLSVRRFVSLCV